MQAETKKALERFFGMSTWDSNAYQDEHRFFDFIVEAFKNNDKGVSLEEMRTVAEEKEARVLNDYEIGVLAKHESLYQDGITILNKYLDK